MTKAVMISIRPKWCDLIASGKKTIEVRKTRPKIETPFKCYIYCTMDNASYNPNNYLWKEDKTGRLREIYWNGKVIGEFVCDYIEYYVRVGFDSCPSVKNSYFRVDDRYYIHPINYENMQLSKEQLERYADGTPVYGWHISDLVIYDQPKELGEFYGKCNEGCEDCYLWQNVRVNSEEFDMDCSSKYYGHIPLKRPPQSWCYVEELK